jgi:predicted dehydrogenase
MNPSVRIGIVGVGAIAQVAHLPALAKLKGAELVALCDSDGVKARQLADRFGVPDAFTDIEDLLDAAALDAVIISTPNHLHEPHVLSALATKKIDVLCERPVALTAAGVQRIITTAERVGRKVAVGNNHRFRTDVQAARGFLRGGELGALAAVRAGHFQVMRVPEGWRFRKAESGGGVLLEHGLPLLDLAFWLADHPPPVRVTAHLNRPRGKGEVEDSLFAVVECAGGLTITVDVCWEYVGTEDRWWFDVLATRGSAELAPLRVVKQLNGKPVDVTPRGASARETAFIQSYRAELAHFLAVIRGEVPYEAPTHQVTVVRVIEAIYRAANEGTEVRL